MKKLINFILIGIAVICFTVPVAIAGWDRELTAEWEYTVPEGDTVTGFKLYNNDVEIVMFNGDVRTGTFTEVLTSRSNNYTLTAVLGDGTESPKSDIYVFKDKGPKGKITNVK